MDQDEKKCGNCKYWCSFFERYDGDPDEPTDCGHCDNWDSPDPCPAIDDYCEYWKEIE